MLQPPRQLGLVLAVVAACLGLGAGIGAPRVVAAEPAKATVEKVLAFYKTDEMLGDSLEYVEAALARRKKEVTIGEARVEEILALARRIYRKKNLFDVFKVAYAKNTTLENMDALYKWMITVKGIKLRQGYEKLYADDAKAWDAYFEKEQTRLLKPNRKNAIQTFETATEQHELHVGKAVGAELAVNLALNAFLPKTSRDTVKVLKDRAKIRRSSFVEEGRAKFLVVDFYLFRDMKNEEIDEASKFASTAVGQAATKSYLKALELTLESAASTLAAELLKGTK